MDITAELKMARGGVFSGLVSGSVKSELAVKADYTIGIPEIIESFSPRPDKKDI